MISAVFRRGGDVSFVVEELKAVFDPRGGHWMGGRYVPSLLAAIGEVIETHMRRIGFIREPVGEAPEAVSRRAVAGALPPPEAETRLRTCPRCSLPAMILQENCLVCTSCGHSKCS
jgi:ribonucleoside-diphosphate reductase alpha chain